MAARRNGFVAEHAARRNDADRRRARLHGADLDVGRVGAQRPVGVSGQKEGVLHVAGRVFRRKIQGRKVVPVVLHFGSLSNGKAHSAKDVDELVAHLTDRVVASGGHTPPGAGYVFGRDAHFEFDRSEGLHLCLHRGFELIQQLANLLAFFGRHRFKCSKQVVEHALAAEKAQAKGLGRFSVQKGR